MANGQETHTAELFLRDPRLYSEDGNIVLSAKDARDRTVYFRLHKSILAKHSPIFADMFALPPVSTSDVYEGVPLVEMPDDADTLRRLIALLYDPQCVRLLVYFRAISLTRSGRCISVILKGEDFAATMYEPAVLARKYQVDWIRHMVASHLESQWPRTLAGWDRVANAEVSDALAGEDLESWEPDDSLKLHRLPEPLTAIRLARECDVPMIIPVAFLHLLRSPLEIDADDADDLHARVWQAPERALLTAVDLYRLALARERIGKWFSSRPDIQKNCGSEKQASCQMMRLRTRCTIATNVIRDGNVLAASQWVMQNGAPSAGICPLCSMWLRDEVRKMREQFFALLSTFFQL